MVYLGVHGESYIGMVDQGKLYDCAICLQSVGMKWHVFLHATYGCFVYMDYGMMMTAETASTFVFISFNRMSKC